MTTYQTDVVIIGAGLTGLTTAHYLNKMGKKFLVVEKKTIVGGVIQTATENEFTYEKGPSTGVMSNDVVQELFDDLKQYCALERASNAVNKRYILKGGKWKALPSGAVGGVLTPLFTFADKLRLLGEPFRKPGTNPNETLAQLVKRRMGQSFLNYAVDPFILGVYAGDPDYLVTRFALPKLYNLEQKYGSFIGGSIKMAREKAKLQTKHKKQSANRIFSVEGGLSNFMKALHTSAGTDNFILGYNIEIKSRVGYYEIQGVNAFGQQIRIEAKQVISTVGAHELPKIFPFIGNQLMDKISNLQYAKVIQISLGFKKWTGFPLDAFGGLIPFKENRNALGILFPSAFLKNRAPKGGVLLSGFIGGVRRPDLFEMSDDQIKNLVEDEIKDLMGISTFEPDLFNIYRYRKAIPQYGKDCEERFEAIDLIENQYSGLQIGGNLRNGIGMADRILQGKSLAENIK